MAMVAALAYLPVSDVLHAWKLLSKNFPPGERRFCRYVQNTWVYKPAQRTADRNTDRASLQATFPPKLWSCHDAMHLQGRTSTNACEARHAGWNRAVRFKLVGGGKKKLSLEQCCMMLAAQEVQVASALATAEFQPNIRVTYKRKYTTDKYARIRSWIDAYMTHGDALLFLEGVGTLLLRSSGLKRKRQVEAGDDACAGDA